MTSDWILQNLDQANKKINLGLDRVSSVLEELWRPQDEFNVIHVAGTNGKGSVCAFLELMYLKFKPELRVAKYTSPHLISVTERIRVQGNEISEEDFKKLYDVILRTQSEGSSGLACEFALDPSSQAPQDDHQLTEFEKITCVAFLYFKEQGVDLAILETGLGGRLDATNICENKLATAITNVSFDHMDYLGNTLEEIRYEKEGIKREGVPHFEGIDLEFSGYPNSITGQNFLLALKIFESLNDVKLSLDEKQMIIVEFQKQSRARFDLDMKNRILVDGAHNPAGAKELAGFINEKIADEAKTFIIAMMDKDYESFLEELMPCVDLSRDKFIFTKVDSDRSLDPEQMLKRAQTVIASTKRSNQSKVILGEAKDLKEALKSSSGFKVITGSLYLAGEYYSS